MILTMLLYVDPGAGGLLTQLFLSILMGAGFYLVVLRKRITGFFRRPSDSPTQPPKATEEPVSREQ